jgi:hypothetical protein
LHTAASSWGWLQHAAEFAVLSQRRWQDMPHALRPSGKLRWRKNGPTLTGLLDNPIFQQHMFPINEINRKSTSSLFHISNFLPTGATKLVLSKTGFNNIRSRKIACYIATTFRRMSNNMTMRLVSLHLFCFQLDGNNLRGKNLKFHIG